MSQALRARTQPPATNQRLRRFLIGAGAMAGALAFTFAARVVMGAIPYPPASIQDIIRTVTPGGLDTAAINTFQHWAMRLLAIAIHLALLGLGGYVATVFAKEPSPPRRARMAIIVAAVAFLVASLLALTGTGGTSWPAFFAYAIAAFGYARIASGTSLMRVVDPQVRTGETPLDAIRRSRRSFLGRAAAVGGLVVVGAGGAWRIFGKKAPPPTIVAAGQSFVPPAADPGFPRVAGLTPEITPNGNFYNVDIDFLKPNVDYASWRLSIGGLVATPFELTYRQLQTQFPVIEFAHTLSCISNEVGGNLVSTAVWRGVRLTDILSRAGLRASVTEIVFKTADGYSDSLPMDRVRQADTVVVFGMNGAPLPVEHGFPARIIVPGLYGMKNPKWLQSITAVDHHYSGYWEVRGWEELAMVETSSRIDVPQPADTVSLPSYLAGIAWAADRGISKVEVSYDGGSTWSPAMLKRELAPLAWRLWAVGVAPGSGPRRVLVRATDGTGAVQTSVNRQPHPGGATGYDFVTFQVN